MSNSTLKGSRSVKGTNPQFLIESVLRNRIYLSSYWKEECFALNTATICDKAVEIHHIGGVHGANLHPTNFLALLLKLLQLQPDEEVVLEYIRAGSEDFKYLKALGLFYVRLVFDSIRVYEILEPHLKDYRKLRMRDTAGYHLTYMDEFVDHLLRDERYCDIILPRLTKRSVLEETEGLKPRKSLLEAAMNGEDLNMNDDEDGDYASSPPHKRARSRSRSLSPSDEEDDKERNPRFRSRSLSRTPSDMYGSEGSGYKSRTPSISPDRVGGRERRRGSRSPSRSAGEDERGEGGRYVSRSPSRSPDRE